ncbi:MAG: membrane dipeptidase [Bacteroidaceae bacterium]|nr:membrane dipeptidase [Bacteroidaceae bacterium]
MKKLCFRLSLMGLYLIPVAVNAQHITYIDEIKDVYNRADRAAVLTKQPKPVIGVPSMGREQAETQLVEQAGGIPLILPRTSDAAALRDAAALLDGLVLTQGVSPQDEYSVLLYKVATDRNMPVLGTNELMLRIDSGLWQMPHNITETAPFMRQARLYKRAKDLHGRMFTLETHSDLPDVYEDGYSCGVRATNQVSIQKMQEGMLDAEFLAIYFGQGKLDEASQRKDIERGWKRLDEILADCRKYSDFCGIARTPQEALQLKADGKKAFFVCIENGTIIGHDLSQIRKYADKGIVYMTLSHMKDNLICHTSDRRVPGPRLGLTDFGRKVVRELNRCGIMVDCSHTSEQTFWDCIRLSKCPIICSHSGAMALFNHDRNLTDEQLRALARNGGVVNVYAVWNYQHTDKWKVNIEDFVNHIDHCVRVAGIDHVGIGVDFDGGGGFTGVFAENDMLNITMKLLERGYTEEQIRKIWSGNLFRVLNEVQAYAAKHK